ncbi:MAG TPA: cyclopropane-fatty-acyl-phospholipid synthase family protein [Bryobacteraceae bacterium]|jgi:cyclopropane-fatty-acyl-phospholipid synthase|nr:cyclopropane-fatty-acyl-phospholipid synthase family protein [Bryobacteraceae bacterium]
MSTQTKHLDSTDEMLCTIDEPGGHANFFCGPGAKFAVIAHNGSDPQKLFEQDAYSAAQSFVQGQFSIRGDIYEAIRFFTSRPHSRLRDLWITLAVRFERVNVLAHLGSRDAAADNIRFHYDRSNDFYRQFLDSRMQYSAAHFSRPDQPLEEAQIDKLDGICRRLNLRSGDTLLDIGCGWGGLVVHAAERYGVRARGCTLSRDQLKFATEAIRNRGLEHRVAVDIVDYRDVTGRFDKIASVGMFEHVGQHRLPGYFKKVNELLKPGGLFLNRGLIRAEGVEDDAETLFIQKSVFPGGELVHLADVIREGENAGLEPIEMHDTRKHYARTCRDWVTRLQQNAKACRTIAGEATYRTWLLYLAASALNLEDGCTGSTEVLFEKRAAAC